MLATATNNWAFLILLIPMIGIIALWRLSVMAGKIHQKIDELEEQAVKAGTREELNEAWEALKNFCNKECPPLRHFVDRTKTIRAVLEAKYQMIKR